MGLAGLFPAPNLCAQEGSDPGPHSVEQLISEVSSVQPGVPFTVAVHFVFEPPWHNYWENPGDTGQPTTIDWTLPPGFEAEEIQWPIPERHFADPFVEYVYYDEVALLVEITPPQSLSPEGTVTLEASVAWLICDTNCVQDSAELFLELPVLEDTPEPDSRWVDLFRETRSRLPRVVGEWSTEAEVTDSGYQLTVQPSGHGRAPPDSVYFFPADEEVLDHAAPQAVEGEGGTLVIDLVGHPYASEPLHVLRGVLVAEDGEGWDSGGTVSGLLVEVSVSGLEGTREADPGVETESAVPSGAAGEFTLVLALVFAFLGGILLNLMPCVFPILSLKVLGAVGQGGEDRIRIRNQGVVFALGVILSFLALGGFLTVLRAGGGQLGWGFQLQAPLFVAFMAALFFAIGLNLVGLFEVGVALTRVGGRIGGPSGCGESLASGVLATVIATPCTAPFMGAALGFALARSIPETLLIFGLLGMGMALPYLVLSLAPGLLERLPRPGPWMETFRQILAFPMFATVIWLAWVFGQQTGVGGAAYLHSSLLLIMGAGWMVGRWQRTDLRSGVVSRGVSLAFLAGAALLAARGSGQEGPAMALEEGWLSYSQEEVEETLARGRPVFVDFTAAWCLTCQVNERVVLGTEIVQEAFRERDVALFKADWTRQDPEITAALEALQRNGVPVYALYRGDPDTTPYLLPAILTEQIVLDALAEVLPTGGP